MTQEELNNRNSAEVYAPLKFITPYGVYAAKFTYGAWRIYLRGKMLKGYVSSQAPTKQQVLETIKNEGEELL